ncbi:uncharacterized protein MONBRDRAFT_24594 [Monosiga brevicollis MX1]|uniref:R-spondin Fu-CRD domain-containing protein n=1 Tax=Monosiga brevicollis TaxID=81824 RepID=A9UWX0_MONBE|nr:uncharacterized protein MONBRDRAFT_24594 [Monosiga brevicollis MX1]EDQ90289.1 predicted protein [Monosiga brevicollis MX1]|eukprot:XP_001745056.1 hypothetical protein [Monosiga brevicollis MX1]
MMQHGVPLALFVALAFAVLPTATMSPQPVINASLKAAIFGKIPLTEALVQTSAATPNWNASTIHIVRTAVSIVLLELNIATGMGIAMHAKPAGSTMTRLITLAPAIAATKPWSARPTLIAAKKNIVIKTARVLTVHAACKAKLVHCGYFVVPSTTNRDETTPMPSTGSGDDELSGEQPTTRAPEDMTTAKVTKTVSAEPTTGADAEPTTGAAAEPTTEAAAEPTTAAAAEPTTGAAAEPTTEAAAEPTTEAAAEPTTEAAAEPTTEAAAEPTTEAAAEHTTEAAAEPTTEAAAEHTTEAAAEPTTKAAAEHTTEAAAEPTTKAAAEPTTEEEVVEPTTEQDAEPSTVATLPTQGASSSTSAPASTDTVPDQDGSGDDSGDWGMEPSTTPAICQLDQCYACVADDFAQCAVCKNKFLLHNGACRETCPAGFEAVGKGQFNRFCREIQVEEPTCADEFCHDCAGNRSVCTVCSSGRYLHAGACLEHCPAGYEEVGRGNFNNECRLEALAGCADNECYSCEEDRDLCTMCKNGYFLHEDGCVASCPSGYEPVGRGNFGKYCQLAAFACADEFCHDCSADRNVCSVCGSGRFLFDGACLASCPAGYVNVGSGNYRNTCRRARVCADHCHSCDEDMPETCLVCRHGTYLLNGTCHTTCPAGYTGKGRGNFHNFCEKDRACQRGQDSCDLCDEEADQCVRCRDARYLHEGSCIDACPHTHMPVGRGNFNLECHERGVGCTALVDECYRCNLGGTACEVCKNGFALYNGYCAQTCPDGYRMRGSGNFNRACVTA